jgi:two-component system response regulator TtrR
MTDAAARKPGPGAEEPTAYVVDDDAAIRELLAWLMARSGIHCETFPDARSFLKAYRRDVAGCLVLDLHLPGISGLDLLRTLKERGIAMPVIFLSGRADVPRAVEALKGGAIDFIEKPFDYKRVVALVRECLARDALARTEREVRDLMAQRLATLTPREREVMERVVAGKLSRVIAEELDISIKTVEAHRAHIMEKLGVNSVAKLVQAVMGSASA